MACVEVATFMQTHGKKPHPRTMAKDVIPVDGEDAVVREDQAKAYRGIHWALASIAIFIGIMAILFFTFYIKSPEGSPSDPPTRSSQP